MTRNLTNLTTLLPATLFAALMPFAVAQSAHVASRISGPIDDASAVTLEGNVHPMARAEYDRGTVAPEMPMERMVLVLAPSASQQQQLDALVESQQQPESADYHQWLTPTQFGARFGVAASDLARVQAWLAGHGFTVEPASAGRSIVVFSGSAAQVADTFHTEIHQYAVDGAMHIANAQNPQIPQALAPVVAGILSLHDFRKATRASRQAVNPENTQGSAHYLFPADLATIYDLTPQFTAGNNGAGSSIAISGRSNINLSDVTSFRNASGLPANQPAVILDGKNPGLVSGDQDESTLDVEWAGGMAPGAAVKFVVAASTSSTDGIDLAAQYIVNHKTAHIISTSYGNCEASMGAAELSFYNGLWQQAAAEGISVFVSSGDSGAAGCSMGGATTGSKAAVNGLCTSPYSTCVGGTEFNDAKGNYWSTSNGTGNASALSYIPEKVWNESANDNGSGLWSSGGGVSETYTQPAWQKGIPGANSNGMRAVPDVALAAASHDGYIICENGNWYSIGGTSAASPSFAGILALVDAKHGSAGQGNANPHLYGMLSASANPFHATPAGNNSVPGVIGYTASGAPYNLATGLGSVDANLLVNGWPTSSTTTAPPVSGFTLKPSVTAESLRPGQSATFTVAVAATGSFSSAVSLTAKTPAGATLTFAPASVKPGATATATLTLASNSVAGNITITGTAANKIASTTVSLTIPAAATLAVSTGSASLTLHPGQTHALQVIATTGGSFNGNVALAVTGLPAGVTASWSGSSYDSTVNGSTMVILTLKASASAAVNAASVMITATGDGATATATTALEVVAAPGIAMALSAAQVTLKPSATHSITVTLSPAGGAALPANAPVNDFKITGLPTGVAATWSTPTRNAAGSLVSKLSFTSSKAAIHTTHLTVSANVTDQSTGRKYAATQQATLSVTK